MLIVEPSHDVAGPADGEPVGPAVVHAERPAAVAAAGLLDVALEFAALEPFARLPAVVVDVLNEQGE